MVKESKKEQVAVIKEKFNNAELVIFAEYRGLNVADDHQLRGNFRSKSAEYCVYKNNLVKIAIGDTVAGIDEKIFSGPTSFIFSSDPVAPAKVICSFIKNSEKEIIKIKGGIYQKQFISPAKVKELASLPGREELLTKLVYILNSPISGLVNVLHANLRKLVYALNAVKETKK